MAKMRAETFADVHSSGDTRRPWNKGMKVRPPRSEDVERTEARFRERRRRDVAQALALGVSLRFMRTADDYLHGRGEFSHG